MALCDLLGDPIVPAAARPASGILTARRRKGITPARAHSGLTRRADLC
jgi:hypothetical protein